jgi:hypothetical protein
MKTEQIVQDIFIAFLSVLGVVLVLSYLGIIF